MKTIKGNHTKRLAPAKTDVRPSNELRMKQVDGISKDRLMADVATQGIAGNAFTAMNYLSVSQPGLSITEMVDSLTELGSRVNANDFAQEERMLTAQAHTLNAISNEMFRRAAMNMGTYLETAERYLRLGLKAQSQCRATVETLAAMKNPPIVYAKQANVATGPQQVNNAPGAFSDALTSTHAQAENKSEPNKLLEGQTDGSTRMDAGATRAAATGNSKMEAVEAVNRPEDRRRKGTR